MSDKIREAQEHIAAAEKALATGWFKRKPDHGEAAEQFDAAGKSYQVAKRYTEAKDAYLKAATHHYHSEMYFLAAKSLDNAGGILLNQLKNLEEAAKVFERSAEIFLDNNQADRSIEMHEKAAKALESTESSARDTVKCYQNALDLYESEDRLRLSLDTFARLLALQLKLNDTMGAVQTIDRTVKTCEKIGNRHIMMKQFLSAIILLCSIGDHVGASKRYEKYVANGFSGSDEGNIATLLLDGFEKRDQTLVDEAVKKQHITFLDNQIVKLARGLRVVGAADTKIPLIPMNPEQTTMLCDDVPVPAAPAPPEETDDLC